MAGGPGFVFVSFVYKSRNELEQAEFFWASGFTGLWGRVRLGLTKTRLLALKILFATFKYRALSDFGPGFWLIELGAVALWAQL